MRLPTSPKQTSLARAQASGGSHPADPTDQSAGSAFALPSAAGGERPAVQYGMQQPAGQGDGQVGRAACTLNSDELFACRAFPETPVDATAAGPSTLKVLPPRPRPSSSETMSGAAPGEGGEDSDVQSSPMGRAGTPIVISRCGGRLLPANVAALGFASDQSRCTVLLASFPTFQRPWLLHHHQLAALSINCVLSPAWPWSVPHPASQGRRSTARAAACAACGCTSRTCRRSLGWV